MDRANLPATIRDELGEMFTTALAQAGPTLPTADVDGIEQTLRDVSRRVLGRVVEAVVHPRADHAPREVPLCPTCRQPLRLVDPQRERRLQGLLGDYTLRRASFSCGRCHTGQAPLDGQLGLGAGALSPGLARVACRPGIEDSLGAAAEALAETLRVGVPREAIRRITEGIGAVAEAEEQAARARAPAGREPVAVGAPLPAGAALLVEADGARVHLDDDWPEVKVGLAVPLGPTERGDPETGRATPARGRPSCGAGFAPAEVLWYRLYVEAGRRGLGSAALTRIVVPGDGADRIWRYAARFLAAGSAEIVEIVDIDHARQHRGTVATAVYGQGTPAAFAWLEPLKEKLLPAGVAPILAASGEVVPPDPTASEEVRQAVGYFTTNGARLDYPTLRARPLPIGSGAVASSCKTLIEERETGAGMRWTKPDAQAVASLRALWRSGRRRAFRATHPQCRRPSVTRHSTIAAPLQKAA